MSNDFTFSFGPPVGSFPCGLASKRPDLPGSLGSSPITGPSSLLRAGPSLCLPVLCPLRFLPLEGLPLATGGPCWPIETGCRLEATVFSRSTPAPATSSRHLYTGHRQGGGQGCPLAEGHAPGRAFVPGAAYNPGFDAVFVSFDASAVVCSCSSSRRSPDPLVAGLFRNAHHHGS
jgi:hypothetical protein